VFAFGVLEQDQDLIGEFCALVEVELHPLDP
jgi:hypothetical protein